MLGFKEGDIVRIDGVEFEVEPSTYGNNGWWLKEVGGTTYYYSLRWLSKEEADELSKEGRLYYGSQKKVAGGKEHCYHVWKRYVGAREVYDFCTDCDAKRDIDWRKLGDGKQST